MAPLVETKLSGDDIRVALIIERGKVRPVWFDRIGGGSRERIVIREICYHWTHREGSVTFLNFAVWDGSNSYRLSLNTGDFSWEWGTAEERPPRTGRGGACT